MTERAQLLGLALSGAALIVALTTAGILLGRAPIDCTPPASTSTTNPAGYPYVVRTVMPEDLDR